MDKRQSSLTSLKDIVSEILESGAVPFNPDDVRIWKIWKDVVGPAIAQNAQPLRIKKRTLRVRVSDPIWFQELQFMEQDITERLNNRLGRRAVDKIIFSVGAQVSDD